jgi:hypothetical protein
VATLLGLVDEFSLVALMGDMPDVAENIMALRSCHRLSPVIAFLPSKNAL